jgi:hypothetical protein
MTEHIQYSARWKNGRGGGALRKRERKFEGFVEGRSSTYAL